MTTNAVIDLYHGDEIVSFPAIRSAGVAGIIHKATQGGNWTDSTYHAREEQAREAGLLWGAYHFGTGDASGADQAIYFLSVVNPGPNDLVALDFEENPSGETMTLDQAVEFVETVHLHTGRYPGFYSGSLIKQLLGDGSNETLAKCWLWLAEYGPEPRVPANWSDWTLWQYTADGIGPEPHSVDGIDGDVDREHFNGELDALESFWKANGAAKKMPAAAPEAEGKASPVCELTIPEGASEDTQIQPGGSSSYVMTPDALGLNSDASAFAPWSRVLNLAGDGTFQDWTIEAHLAKIPSKKGETVNIVVGAMDESSPIGALMIHDGVIEFAAQVSETLAFESESLHWDTSCPVCIAMTYRSESKTLEVSANGKSLGSHTIAIGETSNDFSIVLTAPDTLTAFKVWSVARNE